MASTAEASTIQAESVSTLTGPSPRRKAFYAVGGFLALAVICLSVGLNSRKSKNSNQSPGGEAIKVTSLDDEGSLFETYPVYSPENIQGKSDKAGLGFNTDQLPFMQDVKAIDAESSMIQQVYEGYEGDEEDREAAKLYGESSALDLFQGATSMQGTDYLSTLESTIYGTGLGNSTFFCFPRNSTELVQAVASTTCRVVFLSRDFDDPYNVRREMRVFGYKVIIGHPIRRPLILPRRGVVRPFRVMPGGHLDLRLIAIGRRSWTVNTTNPVTRLTVGGSVLVDYNARLTAYDVLFYETPQTWESYMERLEDPQRSRTWGGFIMNVGGDVTLLGCQYWTLRQFGNPTTDNAGSGGDAMTLQGNYVEVGTFHVSTNLYQNSASLGSTVSNWGGAVVLIGSGSVSTNGCQGSWTVGSNIFIAGGVLIMTAYEYVTTALVMARAGAATQFVGGGAMIHIGFVQVRQWGWASSYRAGQTIFVGGGIMIAVGYCQVSSANCLLYIGIGNGFYVGSGQFDFHLGATARDTLCYCLIGAGGSWGISTGLYNAVLSYYVSFTGWQASMILGTSAYVGAGWMNLINVTSQSFTVDQYFAGEGSNIFVGAGGAVLIGNTWQSTRRYSYSTTEYTFWIAGTGLVRKDTAGNKVVTAAGIIPFRRRELEGNKGTLASSASSVKTMAPTPSSTTRNGVYVIDQKIEDCTGPIFVQKTKGNATGLFERSGPLPITYAERLLQNPEQQCESKESGKGFIGNTTECYACSGNTVIVGNCTVYDACLGNSTNEILKNMIYPESVGVPSPISESAVSIPGIGTGDPTELADDVFLLRAEITIHCQRTGEGGTELTGDISHLNHGCVRSSVINDAIRKLIPDEGYRLAVSTTGVIDDLRGLLAPQALRRKLRQMPRSVEVLESCLAWSTYNVYFASARKGPSESADRGWGKMIANSTSLFNEVLEQQKLPVQDDVIASSPAKLCDLITHTKDKLGVPTKTIQPVDAFNVTLSPGVNIITHDSDINPDSVTRNEPYEIEVSNFPNISAVTVVLVPVNVSVTFGFDFGTTIATLDPRNFEASQQRAMKFSWSPRSNPGKYYFKAFLNMVPLYASYSSVFRID